MKASTFGIVTVRGQGTYSHHVNITLGDRLIPAAVVYQVKGHFKLPGIPYPNAHYLNPQLRESINQLVLVVAEILLHVWKVRCTAVYGEAPGINVIKAHFTLGLALISDEKKFG